SVVISTPDHWHALMTLMACAAGKDVYVEKPLTLFVQEGRWMVDAARHYNRVVQVGTQQRSGKQYQDAVGLLRSGHIGKVESVRMGFFRNVMPGFGAPRDSDPPPGMDYGLWLGPAPLRRYNKNRSLYHFRWFWDYSGGQMTNLGAHEIDVVHWAMQVKGPAAVSASGGRFALQDNGETPDTQDALFEYPGFTEPCSVREAGLGRGQGGGPEFFGNRGSTTLSRSGYEELEALTLAPSQARYTDRAEHRESRILEQGVLRVGRLTVILESKTAAARGNCRRSFHLHRPVDHVNLVRAEVGHLSAGVVPEPAEMIKRAILVIAAQRRGTEPQAVIHAGRRLGIAWRAKAWHDVAEKTHAHAVDLADMPPA